MKNFLIPLLACLGMLDFPCGLYVYLGDADHICFVELVPDKATARVAYSVELYDPIFKIFTLTAPAVNMQIEVKDSEDQYVHLGLYGPKTNIYFTPDTPGEHTICIYSNATAWHKRSKLLLHVDIQIKNDVADFSRDDYCGDITELIILDMERIYKQPEEMHYRELTGGESRFIYWVISQAISLFTFGF